MICGRAQDIGTTLLKLGKEPLDIRYVKVHVALNRLSRSRHIFPTANLEVNPHAVALYDRVNALGVIRFRRKHAKLRIEAEAEDVDVEVASRLGIFDADSVMIQSSKIAEDGSWTQSPLSKSITPEARMKINEACGAKPGDVIVEVSQEAVATPAEVLERVERARTANRRPSLAE